MPPAIDFGGLAPALYGGVQGMRDSKRDTMEEQAFGTDQAIRRQRLSNETELQPLRRNALEQEQQLREFGLNTARMSDEERTTAHADVMDARRKEDRLKLGLGQFHTSGDPQSVADAIGDMYPKADGSKPRATRNGDGSITLDAVDGEGNPVGEPTNLKTQKINGIERTADDQLAMFAYKVANPVEHVKQRYATEQGLEKEDLRQGMMTDRAVQRERERGDQRVREASVKSEQNAGRAIERGVRLGKTFVDSSLKTVSVPGHFQATYSSEDDAKLLPQIYKRMGEIVRNDDKEPEEAATSAINEVRTTFLTAKKSVLDAADRLRKAGIDPRDKDALGKARAAGNKDVDALLAGLGSVKKQYGDDIANYLLEQIPAKKK
jgi:hypothetical protein